MRRVTLALIATALLSCEASTDPMPAGPGVPEDSVSESQPDTTAMKRPVQVVPSDSKQTSIDAGVEDPSAEVWFVVQVPMDSAGREYYERVLNRALQDEQLGEVVGSGMTQTETGSPLIEIEAIASDATRGLQVLRTTLWKLSAPETTLIEQTHPVARKAIAVGIPNRPVDTRSRRFTIQIPGDIDPAARHKRFEAPLTAALNAASLGEITGGGSLLGQGKIEYCEIEVEVTDSAKGLELIRKILRASAAPRGAEIWPAGGRSVHGYPVYED